MSDRDDRIEHYYHESAWDLAEWLVDAEDEVAMWKDKYFRIRDLYKGSQSLNGGYQEEVVRLKFKIKELEGSPHSCPECDYPTQYQMYSGGKEWYCFRCDASGEYDDGEGARRVQMLRTEAGRIELRDEMQEYLRDNRE